MDSEIGLPGKGARKSGASSRSARRKWRWVITAKQGRDLGLRLPWLFEHNLIPPALQELAKCIREDANDGAHVGNLSKEDAEDLLDFTTALLERLVTEPKRLEQAEARRKERRKPVTS
jgi:hypothetical protein